MPGRWPGTSCAACSSLGEVPDCRKARGKRYPLRTILAITAALTQELLASVDSFFSPSKNCYTAPPGQGLPFHTALSNPPPETLDKGRGRIKCRRCAMVDISGAEWNGYAALRGRRQAIRIERETTVSKTTKRSVETT